MGGICTPLRLAQQVQVSCWLLLDNGTEFKSSSYQEYLRAVSCHHKTDLCSSQHNLFCNMPCGLGMQNNSSAKFLYMGDFKHHLVTCYCITRFWHLFHCLDCEKGTLLTFFSKKNSAFQSMLYVCMSIYIYSCIYKNNLKGGEKYPGTWRNCVTENNCRYVPIKPTSCVMPWCSFAFQGIQQHCKPKFFFSSPPPLELRFLASQSNLHVDLKWFFSVKYCVT